MATIQDYLNNILKAVYGKDVRQSIHDAIQQCYYDGRSGAIDLVAREQINNLIKLQEGSTTGDAELIDIRVGADGFTYNTAGESVRTQFNNVNNTLMQIKENGLTQKQIKALDDMFKVCAYTDPDVSKQYDYFKYAFGLTNTGNGKYQLVVGTHIFNTNYGYSVNVSENNLIRINAPAKSSVNFTDINQNTSNVNSSDNVNNKPEIFTINAGDTITFKLKNIHSNYENAFSLAVRTTNNADAFNTPRVSVSSGDFEINVIANNDFSIGCLYVYVNDTVGSNKELDLSFEFEFYVNYERYI